MVESPSVYSTVEAANHGGGKGHPLCGYMGYMDNREPENATFST